MNEEHPRPEYTGLTQYPPTTRVATADEQKPLMKMLGKMLAPKVKARMPKKGLIHSQSVPIKHKKKVTYW